MLTKAERIYEIDILRFLAAIVVFFFHSAFRGKYYELYSFEFQELSLFSKYGFFGVDLFFIISGFVILMSIQNKTPTEFFQSRCVRLYPCFWFGVTFTAIVCYFWGAEVFQLSFWQYVLNMTMLAEFLGVPSIDGVYWTLYVEIKFYVFMYIIMLTKKIKYLIYFLYTWAILAMANLVVDFPWTVQSVLILSWAHYFIAGALFYIIRKEGIKKEYAFLLLITYIMSVVMLGERLDGVSSQYNIAFSLPVSIAIITAIFGTMLAIALKKIQLIKHGKIFILLGSLSYPMYLLHHNVGFIYMDMMEPYLDKYSVLFTLLFLVLLLSYICTLYEKWMSRKVRIAITYISNYKK